jgi:hypothetical protein
MIAGALLIVAASVCFAASLIVDGMRTRTLDIWALGYALAGILGVVGLGLLLVGLTKDRQ